ncbi:MAG: hypothetical protein KFB93_08100 [Simkaniaceae bacterium]|nr:MAG: hypothetical protein KFB93_08100 [Simkaniaceae bacterium]
MSDTSGVGGAGQPQYSQEQLQKYQEDYQKGFDLFQKAFSDYNQPHVEEHKKAQLRKVMSEALQVMNETACVALKKGKLENEQKLSTDYSEFLENPTPENQKKISDDINSLK